MQRIQDVEGWLRECGAEAAVASGGHGQAVWAPCALTAGHGEAHDGTPTPTPVQQAVTEFRTLPPSVIEIGDALDRLAAQSDEGADDAMFWIGEVTTVLAELGRGIRHLSSTLASRQAPG